MNNINDILDFIKTNAFDNLKEVISQNPELAKAKTEQGISLLQFAAYCRNQKAVDLLLEYNKEIDLFEAVSLGKTQTVEKYLVENPESVNSFATDGFTPLGLASYFGHFDLVKLLLGKGANPNIAANNPFKVAPLHSACAISNYEIAEILLKNGADVNAKQINSVTPLHSAAHNGQAKLAKLLIKSGADVTTETDDGKTPLSFAKEAESKKTIEILEKIGGATH